MNITAHTPSALLLGLALCAGLAAFAAPPQAHAQAQARAYAPERIWELPVQDQRRVIAMEYAEQSRGRSIPDDQMRFYLDQIRLSRWTFSQVKRDIAQSLAGGGGQVPGPGPGDGGGIVVCESQDNRSRTCTTPWSGLSRLVRQRSGTPCVQGTTWFNQNGSIRVDDGCRGEFAAAPSTGADVEIRCESRDGRYRTCGTGLYGRPLLARQLSDTPCTLDGTFGLRDGALWVNRGCRGVFRIVANADDGYTVTCSSRAGHRTTCAWDGNRGAPRLVRTLSDSPCIRNRTWGWNRVQGLWVSAGCRGVFGL